MCRGLVSDGANDQAATPEAFEVLRCIVSRRLRLKRLTVVDATNVQREARAALLRPAREHHVIPVAIVFDLPDSLCWERNRARPDRQFGFQVIRRQARDLRRSLPGVRGEVFRQVWVLSTP